MQSEEITQEALKACSLFQYNMYCRFFSTNTDITGLPLWISVWLSQALPSLWAHSALALFCDSHENHLELSWWRVTFKNPLYNIWINIKIMYIGRWLFYNWKKPVREIKGFSFIMTQCPTTGLITMIYFHSSTVHFKYRYIVDLHTPLGWGADLVGSRGGKNRSWLLNFLPGRSFSICHSLKKPAKTCFCRGNLLLRYYLFH